MLMNDTTLPHRFPLRPAACCSASGFPVFLSAVQRLSVLRHSLPEDEA